RIGGHHIDTGSPLAVRRDVHRNTQTALIELRLGRGGGEHRLTQELLPAISQDQLSRLDARIVLAHLFHVVLHRKEVDEIGARLDAYLKVHRVWAEVEEAQLLVEPATDRTFADDGEVRVEVHGAGAGHKEKLCRKILEVI